MQNLHDLDLPAERAYRAAEIARGVVDTVAHAAHDRAFDDGPFDYLGWFLQAANRICR